MIQKLLLCVKNVETLIMMEKTQQIHRYCAISEGIHDCLNLKVSVFFIYLFIF